MGTAKQDKEKVPPINKGMSCPHVQGFQGSELSRSKLDSEGHRRAKTHLTALPACQLKRRVPPRGASLQRARPGMEQDKIKEWVNCLIGNSYRKIMTSIPRIHPRSMRPVSTKKYNRSTAQTVKIINKRIQSFTSVPPVGNSQQHVLNPFFCAFSPSSILLPFLFLLPP